MSLTLAAEFQPNTAENFANISLVIFSTLCGHIYCRKVHLVIKVTDFSFVYIYVKLTLLPEWVTDAELDHTIGDFTIGDFNKVEIVVASGSKQTRYVVERMH